MMAEVQGSRLQAGVALPGPERPPARPAGRHHAPWPTCNRGRGCDRRRAAGPTPGWRPGIVRWIKRTGGRRGPWHPAGDRRSRCRTKQTAETGLDAVLEALDPFLMGAAGATVDGAVRLHPMPDHSAAAVGATGRQTVDRALEAVEGVLVTVHGHREGFVVVVAAHFASRHGFTSRWLGPATGRHRAFAGRNGFGLPDHLSTAQAPPYPTKRLARQLGIPRSVVGSGRPRCQTRGVRKRRRHGHGRCPSQEETWSAPPARVRPHHRCFGRQSGRHSPPTPRSAPSSAIRCCGRPASFTLSWAASRRFAPASAESPATASSATSPAITPLCSTAPSLCSCWPT